MRRILSIVFLVVLLVLVWRFCSGDKDSDGITYESNLIEKEIKNVGKLIVTEGHFAEVLTYKDQQKYLMNMLSFEKKALLVVNADVTVAYDLRKLSYETNEDAKVITITHIPEAEVKIHPELRFYDVTQSSLNPFTGDDYNKIHSQVKANLERKIRGSSLEKNAENRLLSELSKILILTRSMGWTLRYNGTEIADEPALQTQLAL